MDCCWWRQAVCSPARMTSRNLASERKWEAKSEQRVTIPSLLLICGAQDPHILKIYIANVCYWELEGVFFLAGMFLCHADPEDSNTGLQVSHAPLSRHAHNMCLFYLACDVHHHIIDWRRRIQRQGYMHRKNPHAASMGDHATFVFSRWFHAHRSGCRLI